VAAQEMRFMVRGRALRFQSAHDGTYLLFPDIGKLIASSRFTVVRRFLRSYSQWGAEDILQDGITEWNLFSNELQGITIWMISYDRADFRLTHAQRDFQRSSELSVVTKTIVVGRPVEVSTVEVIYLPGKSRTLSSGFGLVTETRKRPCIGAFTG
jgi:hypothetical protein